MKTSLPLVFATFAAFLCLFLCRGATPARAQGSVLIADGRSDTDTPAGDATDAEERLIKSRSLPKARQHWPPEMCEESFSVLGAAAGSFTRAGARQRAVLYRYCVTGHDFANNGIAVFEGGRIVTDILYEGGEDHAIESLADIDADGISEMVLHDGSTHQGYTNFVATLVQLTPAGVKQLGIADVYEDDCGARARCTMTAYRVTVAPGPAPVFYRETFRKRGKRWVRRGKVTRYALREAGDKFEVLK